MIGQDILKEKERFILEQVKSTSSRIELFRPLMQQSQINKSQVPSYLSSLDGDIIFDWNLA